MNYYIDIFATKGFEYLLVIFSLLLFIPFWMVLNKKKDQDIHYNSEIGYTMADGGERIDKKEFIDIGKGI
jgi:hypothetical protein